MSCCNANTCNVCNFCSDRFPNYGSQQMRERIWHNFGPALVVDGRVAAKNVAPWKQWQTQPVRSPPPIRIPSFSLLLGSTQCKNRGANRQLLKTRERKIGVCEKSSTEWNARQASTLFLALTILPFPMKIVPWVCVKDGHIVRHVHAHVRTQADFERGQVISSSPLFLSPMPMLEGKKEKKRREMASCLLFLSHFALCTSYSPPPSSVHVLLSRAS